MDALGKLGINLGLLIANTLNLVLMIVVLWLVAYKPIRKMLQQRRERIAEGINNARRAEEALASAEADRQAILDEARAEAQRILSEARARAEEVASQLKSEAREEASRITAQAREEAAAEKEVLLAGVRDQIIALSIAAANHLISLGMDEDRQRAVIEQFFTAIPDEARKLKGALEVVTAIPLTNDEQRRFMDELGTYDVTFTTDPNILGGVIVRGQGQQVDASFVNQLNALRMSLA